MRRQGSFVMIDLEALMHTRGNRDCLQTPLWLVCPCIHLVEGQVPHEYISKIDYCRENVRGELMIESESGIT